MTVAALQLRRVRVEAIRGIDPPTFGVRDVPRLWVQHVQRAKQGATPADGTHRRVVVGLLQYAIPHLIAELLAALQAIGQASATGGAFHGSRASDAEPHGHQTPHPDPAASWASAQASQSTSAIAPLGC